MTDIDLGSLREVSALEIWNAEAIGALLTRDEPICPRPAMADHESAYAAPPTLGGLPMAFMTKGAQDMPTPTSLPGLTGLTLALCLAAAPQARAQECAAPQTQAEMTLCADQALRRTDGELNQLYKDLGGRLKNDPDTKARLVGAQKAWLAFRDGECAFATSGVEGGSAYPMALATCREGLTQKRVKELRSYLRCAEGDLTCPVPAP
ncbi:lysozyme inhibitor LprI family protein [Rhodospirillum rubrum]|nr:lysozyme inhibitor LprI family protein [Rhodospirillum rubrum]